MITANDTYVIIQEPTAPFIQDKMNEAAKLGYELLAIIPASGCDDVRIIMASGLSEPSELQDDLYLIFVNPDDPFELQAKMNEAKTNGYEFLAVIPPTGCEEAAIIMQKLTYQLFELTEQGQTALQLTTAF